MLPRLLARRAHLPAWPAGSGAGAGSAPQLPQCNSGQQLQRGRGGRRRDDGRGLRRALRRVAARRLRRYHGRCGRNRQFRGNTHSITRPLETRWSERRLAGGARGTREISAGGARARLHIEGRRRDPCALLRVAAGRRLTVATRTNASSWRRSSSDRPCGTPPPGPGGRRTS